MVPMFSRFDYERIRAEREREIQRAALRRLARDTRRNRQASSHNMRLSRIFSAFRAHFRRESRQPMVLEKRGDVNEAPVTPVGQTRGDRMREASRERRSLQKQELRSSILVAAAELFLEHGYEHFSMRQVAERIGYSATTIYLYFENKDDLLFEVVSDGWQRFSDDFLAAAAAADEPLEDGCLGAADRRPRHHLDCAFPCRGARRCHSRGCRLVLRGVGNPRSRS
jgi:hypothetical protein